MLIVSALLVVCVSVSLYIESKGLLRGVGGGDSATLERVERRLANAEVTTHHVYQRGRRERLRACL